MSSTSSAELALKTFPDRFIPSGAIADPNDVMGSVRRDSSASTSSTASGRRRVFPAGTFPQVPIDDPKMYPIYATCVELGIPIFVCAGVPGPRVPFAPQEVELIDMVMFDFPDLVFVTRHGCEPWADLAVKLMLKWPNLYYSTSRVRARSTTRRRSSTTPTRAAPTRCIYAGYFPMGLSLERIMTRMPNVPLQGRGVAEVLARQRRTHPWTRGLTPDGLGDHGRAGTTGRRGRSVRGAPCADREDEGVVRVDRAGESPSWWEELIAHGFHAVHLPEQVGGQGGTLTDLACVIETAAAALLPGPLLVHRDRQRRGGPGRRLRRGAYAPTSLQGPPPPSCCPNIPLSVPSPTRTAGGSTGSSDSILGICAAQRILLAARAEDDSEHWFVLDTARAHGTGLSIHPQRGTDLSTDVGVLDLADLTVDAGAELSGVDAERARCIAVALVACASAGTVRRSADAATEYIRTREQFGRPVGAFQALQHKARQPARERRTGQRRRLGCGACC